MENKDNLSRISEKTQTDNIKLSEYEILMHISELNLIKTNFSN